MIGNKAWKSGILSKLKYKSICNVCVAFICLQILPFSEFCSKDLWALEAESIKVGDKVNKVAEKLLVRSSQEKDRNDKNLWKSGNVLVALDGGESDGGTVLVSAGCGHHFEDIKRVEEEFKIYKSGVPLKILSIADVLDIVAPVDDRRGRKEILKQLDNLDLNRVRETFPFQQNDLICVINSLITYMNYLKPSLREKDVDRPTGSEEDGTEDSVNGCVTDENSFRFALDVLEYVLGLIRSCDPKGDLDQISINQDKINQYKKQKQACGSEEAKRGIQQKIEEAVDEITVAQDRLNAAQDEIKAIKTALYAIFHKPGAAPDALALHI